MPHEPVPTSRPDPSPARSFARRGGPAAACGGAVAAGNPATAAAAAEILADGGTAFDAALAALCAACATEPVLASLGGGGFLLARPAGQPPTLYDFFTQTPRTPRPVEAVDFRPILADFGPATQEFHIGLGAAATPGVVKGLFAVHRDLCRLPIGRIVAPAVRLARQGLPLTRLQAFLMRVVAPILWDHPVSAALFGSRVRPGELIQEGETFRWPALADTLEALARDGERLFYEGEIARSIVDMCAAGGGHLTAADLAGYRVMTRPPLDHGYRGARIITNPPPATGGLMITFALSLLAARDLTDEGFGSAGHLATLVRAMHLSNHARQACGVAEDARAAARVMADPALLARYRRQLLAAPLVRRGTTHVSVIDRSGNAASLTVTNGEGCGAMTESAGFMLNNMLGEEDINPLGFHRWPPDTRLSSMMAPTLVLGGDGSVTALGSGGSNRIRTAILQVLVNLLDFGLPLEAAVRAPRLHVEGTLLHMEPGHDAAAAAAARAEMPDFKAWPESNLYFGGVQAVHAAADGTLSGQGDPRRGGDAVII